MVLSSVVQCLVLVMLPTLVLGDTLQTVDDREFSKMIKDEQYVLVLFCKFGPGGAEQTDPNKTDI